MYGYIMLSVDESHFVMNFWRSRSTGQGSFRLNRGYRPNLPFSMVLLFIFTTPCSQLILVA